MFPAYYVYLKGGNKYLHTIYYILYIMYYIILCIMYYVLYIIRYYIIIYFKKIFFVMLNIVSLGFKRCYGSSPVVNLNLTPLKPAGLLSKAV